MASYLSRLDAPSLRPARRRRRDRSSRTIDRMRGILAALFALVAVSCVPPGGPPSSTTTTTQPVGDGLILVASPTGGYGSTTDLLVVDPTGAVPTRNLTNTPNLSELDPAVNPAKTHVAFTMRQPNGTPAGTGITSLSSGTVDALGSFSELTWMDDATLIGASDRCLYRIALSTRVSTKLLCEATNVSDPTFVPAIPGLSYNISAGFGYGSQEMMLDGFQGTVSAPCSYWPGFSTDGRYCIGTDPYSERLTISEVGGGNIASDIRGWRGAFSPTGSRIAYSLSDSLRVANVDGSNAVDLGIPSDRFSSPVWLPL
jgi:hypothetical protein